jgi:hypothetical protein
MRKHITPSLIISLLALFIATSGASYAALQIPKNSVGAKQLKKNAVTSKKVKNRSLLAKDFKDGQLPQGPQGPQGPAGDPAQVRAYTTPVAGAVTPLNGSFAAVASLDLPAGNYVVMSRANLFGSGSPSSVICSIGDDAAQNISVDDKTIALAQHSAVTLDAPGAVTLSCLKNGAGSVSVGQRWITAIKVNSIN